MKIQLPNGQKYYLDENISLEEKMKKVEELTEEYMSLILKNWKSKSIKFFLDGLANYLVWHKENKHSKDDKEVLSVKKVKQMEGKSKSKSIPFTSLSTPQKETLGIEGDFK